LGEDYLIRVTHARVPKEDSQNIGDELLVLLHHSAGDCGDCVTEKMSCIYCQSLTTKLIVRGMSSMIKAGSPTCPVEAAAAAQVTLTLC